MSSPAEVEHDLPLLGDEFLLRGIVVDIKVRGYVLRRYRVLQYVCTVYFSEYVRSTDVLCVAHRGAARQSEARIPVCVSHASTDRCRSSYVSGKQQVALE